MVLIGIDPYPYINQYINQLKPKNIRRTSEFCGSPEEISCSLSDSAAEGAAAALRLSASLTKTVGR
jgi:hypothetical protein